MLIYDFSIKIMKLVRALSMKIVEIHATVQQSLKIHTIRSWADESRITV